jgi:hypothetical protein
MKARKVSFAPATDPSLFTNPRMDMGCPSPKRRNPLCRVGSPSTVSTLGVKISASAGEVAARSCRNSGVMTERGAAISRSDVRIRVPEVVSSAAYPVSREASTVKGESSMTGPVLAAGGIEGAGAAANERVEVAAAANPASQTHRSGCRSAGATCAVMGISSKARSSPGLTGMRVESGERGMKSAGRELAERSLRREAWGRSGFMHRARGRAGAPRTVRYPPC